MEVIRASEISVHIRTTQRYIPEDDNCRCENPQIPHLFTSCGSFGPVWSELVTEHRDKSRMCDSVETRTECLTSTCIVGMLYVTGDSSVGIATDHG
jgi:hypothetical protein